MGKIDAKDLFVVDLRTISEEISKYAEELSGKNIICTCSREILLNDTTVDEISIVFSDKSEPCFYSATNIIFGINKITYYKNENSVRSLVEVTDEKVMQTIISSFGCYFLSYLYGIGREYGAKSVTARAYNLKTGLGIYLDKVDLSRYDVCITCPPVSETNKFIPDIVDEHVRRRETNNPFDFIILTSYTDRINPAVGINLMLKNCYLGYGRHISIPMQNSFICKDTAKCKMVAMDWITSYPKAQLDLDSGGFKTNLNYNEYKNSFYEMENMTMRDGTHPIFVESVRYIPDDYFGWMFSSAGSVLDVIPSSEFEWYGTHFNKYFNKENREMNPFGHQITDSMYVHCGTSKFAGIVYRRKAA